MKKIYRASIVLPLLFVLNVVMIKPVRIFIPEMKLFLGYGSSETIIIFFTIIWLCCSPMKKYCCNGTYIELLFNLVPIEFTYVVAYAQWHFILDACVITGFTLFEIALYVSLKYSKSKRKISSRTHRRYTAAFQRGSVLAAALFFCIPSISMYFHGLESPTYQAQQDLMTEMFADNTNMGSMILDTLNPYQSEADLWAYFDAEKWNDLTIDERICAVQKLTDFESLILGIPSVPVTAQVLNINELGSYDSDNGEMKINTKYLCDASVEEVINTICHETFHSFQDYIVDSTDWTSPVAGTYYYEQARLWNENQKNYKNMYLYGFDEYQNQELEVAAREYAEKEEGNILSYIVHEPIAM